MKANLLLGLLAILSGIPFAAHADTPRVGLARIQGSINPASSAYLQDSIRKAEQDGDDALVVELDTPGGLLSSVREMAQAIDQSKVPVIVYVTPAGASATSAGALLMLASHVGAMAPGTNLGAAHPVGPGGEEIKGPMGDKATNDTAAMARSFAEIRGRNRDAAEAVVRKSRSFTSDEAVKSGLVEIQTAQLPALLSALQGRSAKTSAGEQKLHTENATVVRYEMPWAQKLLHRLADPNVAAILFSLAMILIYFELSAPGISFAGILGAICLLVAFMTTQMLPIQTGSLALLALGAVLLLAEPFVTAHGAFAAGGILAFTLGLIWLINPAQSDLRVLPQVWIPLVVAMTGGVIAMVFAIRHMRKLSRAALTRIGGGALAGLAGYPGHVESVRGEGREGKALFRGEVWEFRSEMPVRVGDQVEAVAVEGMVVKIKRDTEK